MFGVCFADLDSTIDLPPYIIHELKHPNFRKWCHYGNQRLILFWSYTCSDNIKSVDCNGETCNQMDGNHKGSNLGNWNWLKTRIPFEDLCHIFFGIPPNWHVIHRLVILCKRPFHDLCELLLSGMMRTRSRRTATIWLVTIRTNLSDLKKKRVSWRHHIC